MSSIFKRYTPQSRRVIYFAREAALHAGSRDIDSVHVLVGLLADKASRANTLFRLRELFPEETARHEGLKAFPTPKHLPLSNASKRILAYATEEAGGFNDYWVDTDYLVLGILREQECTGASMLNKVGLEIDASRSLVHQTSRKKQLHLPNWWHLEKPISPFGMQAGLLYLLGIIFLIEMLTLRRCALPFLWRK